MAGKAEPDRRSILRGGKMNRRVGRAGLARPSSAPAEVDRVPKGAIGVGGCHPRPTVLLTGPAATAREAAAGGTAPAGGKMLCQQNLQVILPQLPASETDRPQRGGCWEEGASAARLQAV